MVEPTPLKNMPKSNWIISPIFGVKIKKTFETTTQIFLKCHQSRKYAVVGCGCCGGGGVHVSNLSTKNTFITTKNSPSCSILPATNSSHLQIKGWKMKYPFGILPFFRCHVSFREGNSFSSWWFSNI